MDRIIIQDNFLTSTECKNLIKFYNSKPLERSFETTYPLTLDANKHKSLVKKINKIGTSINNSIVDWFEIVKWPFPNKGKDMHFDTASSETTLSAIIYLNDNYQGGFTYFQDKTHVAPVKGRALFFDGTKYKHGVSIIDKSERYTVAVWLKNDF
jgi:hypothetical protein